MKKQKLWNDLNRIGSGYRLCAMEDLNGWVSGWVKEDTTGAIGIPLKEDGGRLLCQKWVVRG